MHEEEKLPRRELRGYFTKLPSSYVLEPEANLTPDLLPLSATNPVITYMSRPVTSVLSDMDQLKLDLATLTALVHSTFQPVGVTPITSLPIVPLYIPLIDPNGMSPSIRSLFPDVEADIITAVITHDFRACDLFKLDSRYRDKKPSYKLNGATGEFEASNRAAKMYKSLNALLSVCNKVRRKEGEHGRQNARGAGQGCNECEQQEQ